MKAVMGNKLHIVMYHYVRDLKNSRYPEIKGLDYDLFRKQLEFFQKNFNVVTMEEVIEAWNTENVSLPENALLLTFDDGYIDNYLCAFPLLKEFGFQGSFFIPGKTFTENVVLDVNKIHFVLASCTNLSELVCDLKKELAVLRSEGHSILSTEELWEEYAKSSRFDCKEVIFVKRVLQTAIPENCRKIITNRLFQKYVGIDENKFSRELYMNREQILLMKNSGMFIGLHGYDHYWLGNLSKDKLHEDIEKMLVVMNEFVDKDAWVLNYPYGNYSENVLQYIEKKGCKLAMTTEVRIADLTQDSRFLLPRFDCNDFPPKSEKYKDF